MEQNLNLNDVLILVNMLQRQLVDTRAEYITEQKNHIETMKKMQATIDSFQEFITRYTELEKFCNTQKECIDKYKAYVLYLLEDSEKREEALEYSKRLN